MAPGHPEPFDRPVVVRIAGDGLERVDDVMLAHLAQTDAARFSFLMSIPAVAGAGLLEARGIASLDQADIPVALAGFALSFLAGCASLRLLIGMLGRNRLWVFGVYCIAASIVSAAVILGGGSNC